jgi:PTH1 family peptidyl-tRNA hydrolase
MKLIVGLGNPGERYKYTPHNMGFLVVDRIAHRHKTDFKKKLPRIEVAEFRLDREKIILAKPLTYMNLSGEVLVRLLHKKEIRQKDILVVCDDVNLPLGKIRVRRCGSDGGHLGLRSISERLGTKDFARLRIGVAKLGMGDVSEYVLRRFSKPDWDVVNEALDVAAEAVLFFIKENIDQTMNRFN